MQLRSIEVNFLALALSLSKLKWIFYAYAMCRGPYGCNSQNFIRSLFGQGYLVLKFVTIRLNSLIMFAYCNLAKDKWERSAWLLWSFVNTTKAPIGLAPMWRNIVCLRRVHNNPWQLSDVRFNWLFLTKCLNDENKWKSMSLNILIS